MYVNTDREVYSHFVTFTQMFKIENTYLPQECFWCMFTIVFGHFVQDIFRFSSPVVRN